MKKQKIAIATIDTEIGKMTIYYNGTNEPITGEGQNLVEKTEYIPKNLDDACDFVYASYSTPGWNLEMFDL